jgi:hypothetical protein
MVDCNEIVVAILIVGWPRDICFVLELILADKAKVCISLCPRYAPSRLNFLNMCIFIPVAEMQRAQSAWIQDCR